MTEVQKNVSELLNAWRSECRKRAKSFTGKDMRSILANMGVTDNYIYTLLIVLQERGFVEKHGIGRGTTYTWAVLKGSDGSEFACINPNSWDIIFKKVSERYTAHSRQYKKPKSEVVKEVLTFATCIKFLKQACPNLRIYEELTCADGSKIRKDY